MKASNEKEFKALIKKYESLTEDMLLDESREDDSMYNLLSRTTGFGSQRTCTLCKAISKINGDLCSDCVYGTMSSKRLMIICDDGANEETYSAIQNSDNLTDLLIAIKARAKHMKEVWKLYLKQR